MIRYPDCIEKGLFERFSRDYEMEIPALCTGEVFGQDHLSFMDPDKAIRADEEDRRFRLNVRCADEYRQVAGPVPPGNSPEGLSDLDV